LFLGRDPRRSRGRARAAEIFVPSDEIAAVLAMFRSQGELFLPCRFPRKNPYEGFPENARWNAERQAVEFGVEIGEYRGVVRVPRRVFQRLLPERPTGSAVR
jgi:hypothetical protein